MSLHLLIYDRTKKSGEALLRSAWSVGARVYKSLSRVDAHHGATSWEDALAFVATHEKSKSISSIQFWGHGKWGGALIANDWLAAKSLSENHAHEKRLREIRERLLPDNASLIWFRTCETVGARAGHDFAMRLSDFMRAKIAGHTHVIHALQSGLYGLRPGEKPHWDLTEGIAEGTPSIPLRAKTSSANAPHTIHFMDDDVPSAWFDAGAK